MKKHTKLIAMVLTLALAITSISLGNSTTVHAADDDVFYTLINCKDNTNIENGTVTMKPGDIMSFQYIGGCGSYKTSAPTNNYTWECSDKSVATMKIVYRKNSAGNPCIDWIEIRAEKEGTATITGTHKKSGETISFTVSVTAPKMTAKQKKCKHVWKTTRKATCMRNGMKACKKCKLTKVIKQKDHNFVTKTETYEVYQTYPIYVCQSCACKDENGNKLHPNDMFDGCKNICCEEFDAKDYDTNNNGFDMNDIEAAYDAYSKHQEDNKHGTGSLSQMVGYVNPEEVSQTVTRCTACGHTPEQIKNAGQ